MELYRQICVEFEVDTASFSRAVLTKLIRKQVLEIAQNARSNPSLSSDQASTLRLQALAELHTITQFYGDSKPILPIILVGQDNFAELLKIAGIKQSLFSNQAVTAIQQGSGGLFRRASQPGSRRDHSCCRRGANSGSAPKSTSASPQQILI
ncbi:hypothetical protein DFAR_2520001 [Desulfarculales bacterium]